MMTRLAPLRALGLLLAGALLTLSACEKPADKPAEPATAQAPDATDKTDGKKAEPAQDKAPEQADKAQEAEPTDGQPGQMPGEPPLPVIEGECGEYLTRLCKEAGRSSDTCGAAGVVLKVTPPSACKAGLQEIEFTIGKLKEARARCEELATRLCKDLGDKTETCQQVQKVAPEMPPERCVEMIEHYDEVIGELRRKEEMNKPLDSDKQAKIAAKGAPSFGPENAPVTIVEFSDFECPYCSLAASVTTQIKEKYPTQVRVVFRQFPLSFHPNAHLASQAALEANRQGKFWPYHDLLFANQRALTREDLEKYAKEAKLDVAAFRKALDNKTFAQNVDADMALGTEMVVQGTPTMFLNGARVSNPTSFEVVSAMIDEALANKK